MLVLWLLHKGVTRKKAADTNRRRGSGHSPAVRGRLPRGRLGRTAAVEPQSSGQRNGCLPRVDPRILQESTRPHRGRGERADLSVDRSAAWSQPSAHVPQGLGPEMADVSTPSLYRPKNAFGRARRDPSRFPRHETEAMCWTLLARWWRRSRVPRRRGPFRRLGHSYAACGRSSGSSYVRRRGVSGSTSWVHGTR